MIVLGINPGFDGTAAIMIDGVVVAAVAEERLSRIKGHQGFPHRAIEKCIGIAKIDPREIDHVAFASTFFLSFSKYFTDLMLSPKGLDFSNELPFEIRMLMLKKDIEAELLGKEKFHKSSSRYTRRAYRTAFREKGIRAPIIAVDHHLAHAASAYYLSQKDPCLIITADGTGDGLGAAAFIGKNGRLRKITQTSSLHAPGNYYSAVTSLLGFKRHRHEGKVLGLAALGDPSSTISFFHPCLDLSEDGMKFRVPLVEDGNIDDVELKRWLVEKGLYLGPTNFKLNRHMENGLSAHSKEDIAAGAQRRLEEVFLGHIQRLLEKTGIQDIACAGGVFANVVLNQRILDLPQVSSISIHPNMGDGGLAAGAACVVTSREIIKDGNRRLLPRPLKDVYLGPDYPVRYIGHILTNGNYLFSKPPDLSGRVAELLKNKKIVGCFQGRMEYGPRALGNRSILANPSIKDIKDRLNLRLRRTEFMPFAPIVREKDARRYFNVDLGAEYPMKFMTITCDATRETKEKAPGIVHVDGTARPQIIENGFISKVLDKFKKKTGLGICINTSFNVHEEPIVCTPEDALRCFNQGCLDALVLGDFILYSKENAIGR